jgi:hypothetical protein
VRVKASDVIRVLHKAAETWGYPASFLSDRAGLPSGVHRAAAAPCQGCVGLGYEHLHRE